MVVYLNGQFLPAADAKISVLDRGFIFGDGVYEVWRVIEGQLFEHERHHRRLLSGLHSLRIDVPPADVDALGGVAGRLVKENGLERGEATFYVEITRGAAPRTHAFPPAGTKATILGMVSRFEVPHALRASGATAITQPDTRWLHCDIKTVQLLPNCMAKQQATEAGAMEAIYVRDGIVTEGTHTTVFAVKGGALYTHPAGPLILPSITRAVVLEIAKEQGVSIRETPFTIKELFTMDELFVSGTTTDVTPIVTVDGKRIGTGKPGPVSLSLYGGLQARLYGAAVGQR
ncbi:MAG: D-amino acid aminotransferase [Gemmatimonadaceae bacterium]